MKNEAFHKTLTPSYITLSSGDIKDLPKTVTDLNLARCEELTGKEKRAMAQPLTHPLNLPGNLLHLSSLGNIDQLPKSITDLNLSDTKLEGR